MLTGCVSVQGKSEKVRGGLEMLLNKMKQNLDLLPLVLILSGVSGPAVVKYLGGAHRAVGATPHASRIFCCCFVFLSPQEDSTTL